MINDFMDDEGQNILRPKNVLHPTVLCMRWGDFYTAEDVNRLYRMVCLYFPTLGDFVCLTDPIDGLSSSIIAYPIPEYVQDSPQKKRGVWRKLNMWKVGDYGIKGPVLFLDLDIVICRMLTPFVCEHEFCAIKDFVHSRTFNTSVVWVRYIENYAFIVDKFLEEEEKILDFYRYEQDFVTACVGMPQHFFPDPWCVSFKKHLMRPWMLRSFMNPKNPHAHTKIITFHGHPKVEEVARSMSRWKWGNNWLEGVLCMVFCFVAYNHNIANILTACCKAC